MSNDLRKAAESLNHVPKQYVDSVANGVQWVPPVESATDCPLSALWGGLLVGGHYCSPGTRVLVMHQANPDDNWIYVVKARNYWEKIELPMDDQKAVFVQEGANKDTGFIYSNKKWQPFASVGSITTDIHAQPTYHYSGAMGYSVCSGAMGVSGAMGSSGIAGNAGSAGSQGGTWNVIAAGPAIIDGPLTTRPTPGQYYDWDTTTQAFRRAA